MIDIAICVNLDFARISQISCFVFGDFSFLSPQNAKCEVKMRTNGRKLQFLIIKLGALAQNLG